MNTNAALRFLREDLGYWAGFMLLAGLLFSRFLMSVSMIAWLVAALAQGRAGWERLAANKAYLWLTGVFIALIPSIFYTEDWAGLWVRWRIALPFLVLPPAFAVLPPLSRERFFGFLYAFAAMMALVAAGVGVYYLLHYAEMQELLRVSKPIPTPNRDHIRFSLLLCLAACGLIYALDSRFYFKYKSLEVKLQWLGLLFIGLMLHVLAVRSGLLALYLCLFAYSGRAIWRAKRYWLGLGLLAAMFSAPIAAYYTIPSLRAKVHLTLHNIHMFQRGEIGQYADTQRLLSYQITWGLIQQTPIWGVGIGDLELEQRRIYERDYPNQLPMYPHNQFLTYWGGCGLIGLIVFLVAALSPLAVRIWRADLFVVLLHVTLFSSFLTENTLLIAQGVAIHTGLLLLALQHLPQVRRS